MNRLGVSTFLLLNFLSFDVLSLDCEGSFKQKIVVESEEWLWEYHANGYSVLGETLLHKENDEFSIIAEEKENCLNNSSCTTNHLFCAITFALNEAVSQKISVGRIQVTSYSLYSEVKPALESISKCSDAYSQYYSGLSKHWENNLTVHPYLFKKIHAREIKLDKPKNYGDNCFSSFEWKPMSWSAIDYFPVITIERGLN